jgi:UDP:flavonoid glycosyltransferase YjiC (YdhE family)
MRVLFTVQPSTGHLHPLVPVAAALTAAGHDVALCSSASFRPQVAAFGVEHIPAGLDWLTSDRSTWGPLPPAPPPGPRYGAFVARLFADVATDHMVPDLLAVVDAWRPDLVVRESMEFGGCLVAEYAGIPHASIAGSAYAALDSPAVPYFPGNRRMVAASLARHRDRLGLPPDPGVEMPFRYLHLCFTPPAWDGAGASRPPHTHFLRHVSHQVPGAVLPAWVEQLPSRPTVLASLGTVFNRTPGVLEAIVEGLGREPLNLVVAVGRGGLGRFGLQPPNVRLEEYLPQPLLLPRCDAFVTHGGFNSVKEALGAGVPMVVVPLSADQPYSAERCAALGVAEVVGAGERSAGVIRHKVRRALDHPGYRANARRVQAAMAALPGPERAVELLERLARERRPTAA